MSTFIHPQALCEPEKTGEGTRVWVFAHVVPGAVIGNRATVKGGVQIRDGITLESEVTVGPNARVLGNLASTWGAQYRYSSDALLLVLATHPYDSDEYIRDHQEFLEYCQAPE